MSLLTRRKLITLAVPVILANAAAPLLGIVDTAIISHTGNLAAIGAIALAGILFSFIFWGFGFFRMGTSGYVAQAFGALDKHSVNQAPSSAARALADHCLRALLLAAGLGLIIVALQWPLLTLAQLGFTASAQIEAQLAEYFSLRIYGAPAALISFAVSGILIGLGKFRTLLALQLLLNGVNLVLDLVLVLVFDMGVRGIALGTLAAEWSAALAGIWCVRRALIHVHPQLIRVTRAHLLHLLRDKPSLIALFHTNADIFWRTLALLMGFGIFINAHAKLGDTQLAATHLLLQFVTLAAFLLDGFAQVGESHVGQALGARSHRQLQRALRLSSECAAMSALLLAGLLLVAGDALLTLLTPLNDVKILAQAQLHWAAIYIALAWAAFVLDGFFIGALQTRAMRNTTLIATAILAMGVYFADELGAAGLWLAFIAFVLARAAGLCVYLPRILAQSRAASKS